MKKSCLLIFLVFFTLLSRATDPPVKGSLSGIIKDARTGLPLQGVSIYMADVKAGGLSNSRGEFRIFNISEGIHLVEISHVGYHTIAENLPIYGDTKKDFLLSEAIVENNAVIVTGVTKATQLKKIPFQVSVMRKEDLFQSASSNVIESITRKAGVSSVSTGPAISKPLIRGLGYNRVLTINDGVRQEGQQWGDEHGIEIDESSVNKIEILKGPASLVYGSDAMAGVINIITNVPVQANTIQMDAGANYQFNNRQRTTYGNIAGNVKGFNWNVYGSIKAAADYRNKYDGYVYNSKFNEHNAGGYLGYNASWGYSHILLSNFNLETGLVEGERDTAGFFIKQVPGGVTTRPTLDDNKSTDPQFPYQHIRHFKIASDNSFRLGAHRLSLNVGWQKNYREEYGNVDNPDERALAFDLGSLTYTAQLHFREQNGWKSSIGFNGMYQTNVNEGLEQLIPDYSLADAGGFIFIQKEIKRISFSGGARFDNRNMDVKALVDGSSIKGASFQKDFSNFSGSIGAAYQVNKTLNLKFNIARAFRAPAIPELASNGAHEGTLRYEFGDNNLQSELSTQFDAAIGIEREHFSLNVAGYYNNFNNFIFYRKLQSDLGGDSTITVNGRDLLAFKFDQRRAYFTGIEATMDIHPHPLDWLHLQNSFSLVSGKLRQRIEGTNDLPLMPAPRLLTEARADLKKLSKHMRNAYVKIEADNTFRQSHPFTAYETETATAGYTLFNAGIGADILNSKQEAILGISLVAGNITDVAYQGHLSRLKYAAVNPVTGRRGVYNMGRNFMIKLNIPLSITLHK